MSSITSSSLSDTLPSTVPKLDAEGDNWAIFYVRFMDAVEAKGFWGHFDGTSTLPVTTSESSDADIAAKNQWEKDERSAKTLLTQRLPDSEFYGDGDSFKEIREGKVGGGRKGVYGKRGLCSNRYEGEVLTVEVSGEGERERFLEEVAIEKGGASTSGS